MQFNESMFRQVTKLRIQRLNIFNKTGLYNPSKCEKWSKDIADHVRINKKIGAICIMTQKVLAVQIMIEMWPRKEKFSCLQSWRLSEDKFSKVSRNESFVYLENETKNLMFARHRCRQLTRKWKNVYWLPTMATHWKKQLSLLKEMNSDRDSKEKFDLKEQPENRTTSSSTIFSSEVLKDVNQ